MVSPGLVFDKVVIVTGGSRGIGLDISKALAREGASVVIASVDEARGIAAIKNTTVSLRNHQ